MKIDFIDLNNKQRSNDLPKPPSWEKQAVNIENNTNSAEKLKLLQNKAWSTAISPASGIFINFILFYFVGNSLNIYTLIMIFSLIMNQIRSLIGIRDKFREFESYKIQELSFYKLIYFSINAALLGYSAYRLYHIGLLPLSPADYVDLLPRNPMYHLVVDISDL